MLKKTLILLLFAASCISYSFGQSFVSVNPNHGITGQTLNTVITGSFFEFTTSTVPNTFGNFFLEQNNYSFVPNSVSVIDDDNLNVEWTIDQNAPIGLYDLVWEYYVGLWSPPIILSGAFYIGNSGLSGTVYFDGDSSLTQGPSEQGIYNQKLMMLPDSSFTYTLMDGSYLLGTEQSTTKIIQVLPDELWKVTTDSTDTVNVTTGIVSGIDFGIKGKKDEHDIKVSITPAFRSRCDRTSRHQITYHNNGTLINKGTINYYNSTVTSFDSASPPPSNINGNVYSWTYDSLHPGTARNIDVYVTNPPGMTFFNLSATAEALDTLNNIAAIDSQYVGISTTCAYDPNDKRVIPRGVQTQNYTLIPDTLGFIIRFQNTGNDTAFKVVLLDTLDKDILDLNSFKLVSYSHPVSTKLFPSGEVSFTFENILLPDSNVNEPASHGWVRFECSVLPGLPNNTILNNTAYIYFDFNAPVITNTTLNTLVYQIPVGIDEAADENKVIILPNPVTNDATILLPQSGGEYYLKVMDMTGKLVYEELISSDRHVIPANKLDSGVMLYQLRSKDGSKEYHGKFVVM